MHKTGLLIFYRDNLLNLRQLYLGWGIPNPPILSSWLEIPTPVVSAYNGIDIDVTDNLAIDEVNSRIYFVGRNSSNNSISALYYYTWNFNSVNPVGVTKLDHQSLVNPHLNDSECDDYYNVESGLALSPDKNMVFYKGTDDYLWYYFNDRENSPNRSHENWNKTRLESKAEKIVFVASNTGRLFYVNPSHEIHAVDWANADNMRTCDASEIGQEPHYATYKDSISPSLENEHENDNNKIEDELNVMVFPNPSEHTFTIIMTNLSNNTNFVMNITELSGKNVYSIVNILPLETNKNELTWDTKEVNKGIYFYKVKLNDGRMATGKIIKM